jgi:hypothetical protein
VLHEQVWAQFASLASTTYTLFIAWSCKHRLSHIIGAALWNFSLRCGPEENGGSIWQYRAQQSPQFVLVVSIDSLDCVSLTDKTTFPYVCVCIQWLAGCSASIRLVIHFCWSKIQIPQKKAIIYGVFHIGSDRIAVACRIHMLGLCSGWQYRTAAPLARLFSSNWNNCHKKMRKIKSILHG